MILAVDVAYHLDATDNEEKALSAGLLFANWQDRRAVGAYTKWIAPVEPYVPGAFYRRELPCILALLPHLPAMPTVIVIDGYVYLGSERRAGLGKYLYDALNCGSHSELSIDGQIAVVGIAKKRFAGTPATAEVQRGGSRRPLYVTAVGVDEVVAQGWIAAMHGQHRLPTLLKAVDQLCRGR